MEWVETTGATVAAALDAALDELGVDEDDVEYEVIQEPKSGVFGRFGGTTARIRARVKPISREKPGDRNRGRSNRPPRRGGRSGSGGGSGGGSRPKKTAPASPTGQSASGGGSDRPAGSRRRGRGRGQGTGQGTSGSGLRPQEESDVSTATTEEDVPIGEQADVADAFMRGLVGAFGVRAEVSVRIDGDAVLVDVDGEDLGLLVGPKGATLRAIEDLVRTVVQRRTDGQGARIHVDVAGYQAKRRAALAQFATDLAGRVVAGGQELALEPMSAADRKVVHDTVAGIAGVTTTSEGEEPRRRVVLLPE
ncbi:MAG: RNA-binding cell elongation regulator Jag/EloR [Actinomycetota bacterium]